MGFKASRAASELEYDFEPFLPGVKGVTPEPSSDQVLEMQARLRELFLTNDPDPLALTKKLSELSLEDFKDRDHQLAEIYADVCSQQPSTEEIMALPHRVQVAYIGYLSGELNTPTAGSSATRRSLAPVKNA